jgi:hypothetical protein
MSNARTLADYANDDAISGDKIHGGTISGVTLSSPTINTPTFANDAISGDKIHGGTISSSALATSVTMSANHPAVKTALNASGNPPVYACRAWVNFNGTGTVAIRDSGNVSSISDNGTGDYTVNFATAMPDANYAYAFGRVAPDTSGNNLAIALKGTNSGAATGAKTTSSFRLLNGIAYPNSYVDSAEISVLFFR